MGLADVVTKEYMRKPDVFADAFNYLLYNGRQVIKPSELKELDTAEIMYAFGENRCTKVSGRVEIYNGYEWRESILYITWIGESD